MFFLFFVLFVGGVALLVKDEFFGEKSFSSEASFRPRRAPTSHLGYEKYQAEVKHNVYDLQADAEQDSKADDTQPVYCAHCAKQLQASDMESSSINHGDSTQNDPLTESDAKVENVSERKDIVKVG